VIFAGFGIAESIDNSRNFFGVITEQKNFTNGSKFSTFSACLPNIFTATSF